MVVVEAEAGRPRLESPSWLARMREFVGIRTLALGAAALLVVGLFSWNMILQGEMQDLQGRIQSLQNQPQEPQMVELGGTGAEQGAQAELVTLEGDRVVLVAEDMPPLPEGKTYQIWVIEDDTPQPSGLFEPGEDSVAAVVEHPLDEADAVAVTVEPEGGSPKPTTDPVLAAKV